MAGVEPKNYNFVRGKVVVTQPSWSPTEKKIFEPAPILLWLWLPCFFYWKMLPSRFSRKFFLTIWVIKLGNIFTFLNLTFNSRLIMQVIHNWNCQTRSQSRLRYLKTRSQSRPKTFSILLNALWLDWIRAEVVMTLNEVLFLLKYRITLTVWWDLSIWHIQNRALNSI